MAQTFRSKLLELTIVVSGVLALFALFMAVVISNWLHADHKYQQQQGDEVVGGDFKPQIVRTAGMPPRWILQLQNAEGDAFTYTIGNPVQKRMQDLCDAGWPDADAVVTWLVSLDANSDAFISTQEAIGAPNARVQVLKTLEGTPPPPAPMGPTPAPSQPVQEPAVAQPTQPVAPTPPVQPPPPRPTLRDLIDVDKVNYWILHDRGDHYVLEIYTMDGPVGYRYRDQAQADEDVRWLRDAVTSGTGN